MTGGKGSEEDGETSQEWEIYTVLQEWERTRWLLRSSVVHIEVFYPTGALMTF